MSPHELRGATRTAGNAVKNSRARGQVNVVSLLIFAVLVGAGWWAYLYFPLFLDDIDARTIVAEAANATLQDTPERMQTKYFDRLNSSVGWHYATDEMANTRTVTPGLGISPEQFTVERDRALGVVRVHLDYARTIQLKPFNTWRTFRFAHDKEVRAQ